MAKVGYARVIEKRIKIIKTTVYAQVFTMVMTTLLSMFFYSVSVAGSVLFGSLCSVIPSVYFAYRTLLYKFKIEADSKKFLTNLFVAEVVKFILVICMFIAVFSLSADLKWLSAAGVLVGFIVTYMSVLGLPLISANI